VASPFGCRSGHIPLSRKPPCPGRGRLARASALLLMHRQRSITMRGGQHTPCSNDHRPLPLWLERHSRTTEQRDELAPFHCPNATSRVYEYTFWLVASSAILAERVRYQLRDCAGWMCAAAPCRMTGISTGSRLQDHDHAE